MDIDLEFACAVAVNLVEVPGLVVTPDAVTLHGAQVSPWLNMADPLHSAARDYLLARRDALLSGNKTPGAHWGYSGAAKTRDMANQKAIQAKNAARTILQERGVLDRARAAGYHLFV